jgi:hypothetical protein
MPTAMPSRKSGQLGATPSSICSTSRAGSKTSAAPIPISRIEVTTSATASTKLSRADSSVPRMLRTASAATKPIPTMTSRGESPSGSQSTAR